MITKIVSIFLDELNKKENKQQIDSVIYELIEPHISKIYFIILLFFLVILFNALLNGYFIYKLQIISKTISELLINSQKLADHHHVLSDCLN